jgi:integrase
MSTFDIKIWAIREHKGRDRKTGKARSTYRVRWIVAGNEFGDTFQTKPLAESFRSKLIVYQREGVAFDEATGLPEPMARELRTRSWYEHAIAFVDTKWQRVSPRQRQNIAESLAGATVALLSSTRGAPTDDEIRRALYWYSFNKTRRSAGPPPADLQRIVQWVSAHTVSLADFKDAALTRKALDAIALRRDGRPAAATTIARKRAVLYGALGYAVELGLLPTNPIDQVNWTAPRSSDEVDRRSVVNPDQALDLLTTVSWRYPRLVAFFACMYYAALRPAEVMHLRIDECELPERGWGALRLTGSIQHSGADWADDPATILEERALKHRARTATRFVPAAPPLVRALRWHIALHGHAADGRLFFVPTFGNKPVSKWTYTNAWRQTRKNTLTPAQLRSPLAARPYDLRHAAVSLWLNAGVPATQVAEWAGHSVHVLLRVYAKCIDGQEEAARRRMGGALGLDEDGDDEEGDAAAR